MKFSKFLKEKILALLLLLFAITTSQILLLAFNITNLVKFYIAVTPIIAFGIAITIEYYQKKKFYNTLQNTIENLEEKYLSNEIIDSPNFIEGKITKNILDELGKSMLENVNKYKYMTEDYKEYIELWIHEIKIPIATSKMVIENNKTDATKSIDEELDKIEDYIEQALFYARSNTVEKDYIISKSNLKDIVNTVILKNKNVLISNKIGIDIKDIEKEVYIDSKWAIFIINQIIQNSIKYMKKANKKIEIWAEERYEKVILFINDNGIGIKQSELAKVFEKGFTGTNGRIIGKKSTGIGLYLCKKLCDKLGLSIELSSIEKQGTEVEIVFPKSSFINMEK